MQSALHGRGVKVLAGLGLIGGLIAAGSSFAADTIGPQLRKQVEKSRSEVGELKPWQEEAFLAEVLPNSSRFVKDYSSKGGVVSRIDIDFEGIRRYLSFHADQILRDNKTTVLAVRATESCTPCVGAVPFVRKDLKERLERRGFRVVELSAQESASDLSEVLSRKNAAGWVSAVVKNVEDAERAGEFRNELILEFRFPGTAVSQVQKQMEIFPTDSIEGSMSRMALDGLTELGNKVRQARLGSLEAEGNEGIEISVNGITSFSQLLELKRALQAQFQNSARVVEKRLQRGNVALSVVGDLKPSDVRSALQAISHSQLQFKVTGTNEQVLQVSATPKG